MIGNNLDEVRTKLLRLGFEILSCHEETIIASKRFIYQSDIAELAELIDSWYIFDNKLNIQVNGTRTINGIRTIKSKDGI